LSVINFQDLGICFSCCERKTAWNVRQKFRLERSRRKTQESFFWIEYNLFKIGYFNAILSNGVNYLMKMVKVGLYQKSRSAVLLV
jgi:hypothetical protein